MLAFSCYCRDFQAIDDTLLAPIIKALGPVANISVESQVINVPKFLENAYHCFVLWLIGYL